MKHLLAFFIFYGIFLQETSAQKVELQEVFSYSGDNIIDVIEEIVAREAIIKLATQGLLVKSNSDVVTDPKKPKVINYVTTVNFKESKTSRLKSTRKGEPKDAAKQPCSIGLVSLVSDDGCNVSIQNNKGEKITWLQESKKGHDISKGRRDYNKILFPGIYKFEIEYSQTYYNPPPEDLDGISLLITPIIIDISVRADKHPSNGRILIKKGQKIEMALNVDWLGRRGKPPLGDQIIWEMNQLSCQGNFETHWKEVGKGAWCEYCCNTPGIFRIRARIGDKIFTYTRRSNEPHVDATTKYAHIGDSACIGVAEDDKEIKLLNLAYGLLGDPCYAYETPWFNARDLDIALRGEGRYWTDTQREAAIGAQWLRHNMETNWSITYFSNNLRNTPKCNYFLYYQCRQAGFNIPNKIHLRGFRPPVVAEWKNPSTKIGNWLWKSANNTLPQPGWIALDEEHCGFIDYDGGIISGGTFDINKKITLDFPKYFRMYQP